MNDALIAAVAAVIVGGLSFLGTYLSNRKSQALIAYRIEQLERKQDRHNNVIERTFKLEGRMTEAEHDIRDLKNLRSSR